MYLRAGREGKKAPFTPAPYTHSPGLFPAAKGRAMFNCTIDSYRSIESALVRPLSKRERERPSQESRRKRKHRYTTIPIALGTTSELAREKKEANTTKK